MSDTEAKKLARAEYHKLWYEANRDEQRVKSAKRYQDNKESEKARRQERRQDPVVRLADLERQRKWRESHKEEQAEKQRVWRQENAAHKAQTDKAYRLANVDRVRANKEAWTKANAELVRHIKRKWAQARPHLSRVYACNRRARERGQRLSSDLAERLLKAQRGKCANCGCSLKKSGHHLDHIVPLALGGANLDTNIQLLCPPCNHSKSAKDPIAWAQSLGRLL